MNNKKFLNKKIDNFSLNKLDWSIIQTEMKNKLGIDIYESWLRKIEFVEELKNSSSGCEKTNALTDFIFFLNLKNFYCNNIIISLIGKLLTSYE